ncbi:lipocalin-like domain-containing protein [Nocardia sp. NPDC052254]|uniref:lipocalin-like domain-containing protein n=1 Tax=Nocardia sp. NPDC052254 TaxID=3155681 RepID=UPI003422B7BF
MTETGGPDPRSIAERVLGAWELVSYTTVSETGQIAYPLGERARGLIVYTADGFMSAQIMRPDRPHYASRRVHGGAPDERARAAAGYLAYSGRYEVDEAGNAIRHDVAVSLYPNWVGDRQLRHVEFTATTMTLSSDPLRFRTTTLFPRLVWQRPGTATAKEGHDAR